MLPPHIQKPSDLVTSHRAVCEGFLSQAQAKTQKAAPVVGQAKLLLAALHKVANVESLLKLKEFRSDLIAAAGFSAKARGHLSDAELDAAVSEVFEKIFFSFSRERLPRRNCVPLSVDHGGCFGRQHGQLDWCARQHSVDTRVIGRAQAMGVEPEPLRGDNDKVQRIRWRKRRLLFDRTPKIIGKNVDVILLDDSLGAELADSELFADPNQYLACGELKGGIDPAAADERWKTANSALDRIRVSFKDHIPPPLFLVGAAIAPAMAKEIFEQLQSQKLTYAANLTVPEQLADLAAWLVGL